MSIPSTLPGSIWAWRLKRLAKKKCNECEGECTDCPHSATGATAAAPDDPPGEPACNGRGDAAKRWSASTVTVNGRSSPAGRPAPRSRRGKPPAA